MQSRSKLRGNCILGFKTGFNFITGKLLVMNSYLMDKKSNIEIANSCYFVRLLLIYTRLDPMLFFVVVQFPAVQAIALFKEHGLFLHLRFFFTCFWLP